MPILITMQDVHCHTSSTIQHTRCKQLLYTSSTFRCMAHHINCTVRYGPLPFKLSICLVLL